MVYETPCICRPGIWLLFCFFLCILPLAACSQTPLNSLVTPMLPATQAIVQVATTYTATPTRISPALTSTATPLPTSTPSPQPTTTPLPTMTMPVEIPVTSNVENLQMLYVPGSIFQLGASASEQYQECQNFRRGCQRAWYTNAEPVHTVLLNSFYIDQYEVTYREFLRFLNDLGTHERSCMGEACFSLEKSPILIVNEKYESPPSLWHNPMNYVSWYGAAAYCQWRDARLPTEAEWEMVAGWQPETGEKFRYPWGNTFAGETLNFCDKLCIESHADSDYDDGYAMIAPVGRYESGRSPVGAYDMAGNLWEWVNDWYAFDYYKNSPTANPQGSPEGAQKVVRGGSWYDTGNFASTTFRIGVDPAIMDDTIGFRCAQSATK